MGEAAGDGKVKILLAMFFLAVALAFYNGSHLR
jgi:hypothetical protein